MDNIKLYQKWRKYRIDKYRQHSIVESVMTKIYDIHGQTELVPYLVNQIVSEFDFVKSRAIRVVLTIGLSALGALRIYYAFRILVP